MTPGDAPMGRRFLPDPKQDLPLDSCHPPTVRTPHRLPGAPVCLYKHLRNALQELDLLLTELVELLCWDPSYADRNSKQYHTLQMQISGMYQILIQYPCLAGIFG